MILFFGSFGLIISGFVSSKYTLVGVGFVLFFLGPIISVFTFVYCQGPSGPYARRLQDAVNVLNNQYRERLIYFSLEF